VPEPRASADGATIYLVRLVGTREVALDVMSPTQYESYKNRARSQARAEVSEALDFAYFEREFGLWLAPDMRTESAEGDAGQADG
jgi:hypothetical protein